MRAFLLSLGLGFLGFVGQAAAHETWLLPAAFSARTNAETTFEMTSGMAFPEPEYAIRPERVARACLRLGTERAATLKQFKTSDKALRITSSLAQAGLATVWVELHPRALELPEDKVDEYLDEIGATDEIRTARTRRKGHGAWKETYVKHAKTFVAVGGDARSDPSWREPIGVGLELVPLTNPLELRAGQPAAFQLLARGKPLAGAPVGLLMEGAAGRVFQKSDPDGWVSFPLERAGRLLVFAVDLRPAKGNNAWESDFTTLTLLVQAN